MYVSMDLCLQNLLPFRGSLGQLAAQLSPAQQVSPVVNRFTVSNSGCSIYRLGGGDDLVYFTTSAYIEVKIGYYVPVHLYVT